MNISQIQQNLARTFDAMAGEGASEQVLSGVSSGSFDKLGALTKAISEFQAGLASGRSTARRDSLPKGGAASALETYETLLRTDPRAAGKCYEANREQIVEDLVTRMRQNREAGQI